MSEQYDCILPCKIYENIKWPKIKAIYVWVAYDREYPYLPIATADSAKELAKKAEVSCRTVFNRWIGYSTGRYRRSRFHRIKIGAKIID